ncbi:hypothetical protein ACN3XK_14025 [Actinomadura welshii]
MTIMPPRTPPRPIDIAAVFPELAAYARKATRLHPRPGEPGPHESSVGGPLLWPADEPWPCGEPHDDQAYHQSVDAERRRRRILAGGPVITAEQQEELQRLGELDAKVDAGAPAVMLAVAQLYTRDVPGLEGPPGADVLQVLWCPRDHEPGYCPVVTVRWRRSSDVVDPLPEQPEPEVMDEDMYLPEPCVLHPEEIVEYPDGNFMPSELYERITAWEETGEYSYQYELSNAPGWKVGGHTTWSLSGYEPIHCGECGAGMEMLLAIASYERDEMRSWWPEGAGNADAAPTRVQIGRGSELLVFTCPESFDHPPKTAVQ